MGLLQKWWPSRQESGTHAQSTLGTFEEPDENIITVSDEIQEQYRNLIADFRRFRSRDPLPAIEHWQRSIGVEQILKRAELRDTSSVTILTGSSNALPLSFHAIDTLQVLQYRVPIHAILFSDGKRKSWNRYVHTLDQVDLHKHDFSQPTDIQLNQFIVTDDSYIMTAPTGIESSDDETQLATRICFHDPKGAENLRAYYNQILSAITEQPQPA